MAMEIPNPIPISCTTCHQAMRVEFQDSITPLDEMVVAAECGCGRRIGTIFGARLIETRHGRPLIAHDIAQVDVGEYAQRMVEYARDLMARGERLVAAATWARGGKR